MLRSWHSHSSRPWSTTKFHDIYRIPKSQDPKSCGDVDLRGDKLGPVRNQGERGWCYANTAADLLSYALGEPTSAFATALSRINRSNRFNPFNYCFPKYPKSILKATKSGYIDKAIKTSINEGLCLEKKLSSEDNAEANINDLINANSG
jgi:hypothetical protein